MAKRRFIVELSIEECVDSFEFIKKDIEQELSCCCNLYDIDKITELPTEHGDLIDRDALPIDTITDFKNEGISVVLWEDVMNAPTVLEASTEELSDEQIYQLQSSYRDYCEMYEPTYNPEDGSM